jgi:very-short-patch-repair endonuclease
MHRSDAQSGPVPAGGAEGRVVHPDAKVALVASRQAGNITTAQLRAAGLSRGAIARRIANGRLHRRHRGVFAVGHEAEPPFARQWAAVLACGKAAVISFRSAVELLGLLAVDDPHAAVDVTIPSRSTRRHEGVRVHQTSTLEPGDTGTWRGVPVTSPARTLLDFASVATPRELERAVSEALVQKLVTERELRATLARHRGHRGAAMIRALLAAGPRLTHKGVEELLLAKLRKARVTEPATNVPLHGWNVDFYWPDEKLVVETDSARFHGVPAAVERDRRKDADLRARGYTVLRYTWRQVADETEFVIAEIAAELSAQRTRTLLRL